MLQILQYLLQWSLNLNLSIETGFFICLALRYVNIKQTTLEELFHLVNETMIMSSPQIFGRDSVKFVIFNNWSILIITVPSDRRYFLVAVLLRALHNRLIIFLYIFGFQGSINDDHRLLRVINPNWFWDRSETNFRMPDWRISTKEESRPRPSRQSPSNLPSPAVNPHSSGTLNKK